MHVTAPAHFGGLESMVRLLASAQHIRGYRVCVVGVLDDGEGAHPYMSSLSDAEIETHIIAVSPRAYRRERTVFRALLQSWKPSIVHTHGYRPDIVDGGVAARTDMTTVTTVHGFTGGSLRNRFNEWLQQRAIRSFDGVVAVSDSVATRLRRSGVRESRIRVIPNAYDADRPRVDRSAARARLGIARAEYAIGWVGRLSREKGPDVFVAALERLAACPLAVVVGEGPERAALERRVAAGPLASRVYWLGVVPDAGSLFGAFDALVLSSRTEGTPVVVLEAMAARVPIIATRVGGIPAILDDATAWLVPSDDPAALAGAIARVRADPAQAATRAEAARRRLEERFGVGAWIESYRFAYDAATRVHNAGGGHAREGV